MTIGVNASLVSGTGELALSLPTIPPQPMSDLADLGDIFSTVSQTAPPVMLHIKGRCTINHVIKIVYVYTNCNKVVCKSFYIYALFAPVGTDKGRESLNY